jgi:hypothetical protein
LGEMGFIYFLRGHGIYYDDTTIFEIYNNVSVGDRGDIIMPNRKIIDVKTTRYNSIGANVKDLYKYDYFVGTSLKMNSHNHRLDPLIEICGYVTKRAPWKKKKIYGKVYMNIDLIYLHNINDIITEWNKCS